MTVWYTADPHLGHTRICEFCGRPYESPEAMNRDLIDRWNTRVHPDDVVWLLGDFALGRIADTLPLVAELNGHIRLVPGNHDRCHPMHKDSERWRDRYLRAGFATVEPPTVTEQLPGVGPVTLCHFPPWGDPRGSDPGRFPQWRPADTGGVVVHGHVHGRWRQNHQAINVGVDAWGGYPVAEADVAALATQRAVLPPLQWWPAGTPLRDPV